MTLCARASGRCIWPLAVSATLPFMHVRIPADATRFSARDRGHFDDAHFKLGWFRTTVGFEDRDATYGRWNVTEFTPVSAVAGGLLIGSAAALLLLLNGRIAGISGIVGAVLPPVKGVVGWQMAFLAGLLLAPIVYVVVVGAMPAIDITSSPGKLVVAGLLVGIGSRLGSGCTSGHGVCGLARGSVRSLVATGAFMAAAVVAVYVTRHMMGP